MGQRLHHNWESSTEQSPNYESRHRMNNLITELRESSTSANISVSRGEFERSSGHFLHSQMQLSLRWSAAASCGNAPAYNNKRFRESAEFQSDRRLFYTRRTLVSARLSYKSLLPGKTRQTCRNSGEVSELWDAAGAIRLGSISVVYSYAKDVGTTALTVKWPITIWCNASHFNLLLATLYVEIFVWERW